MPINKQLLHNGANAYKERVSKAIDDAYEFIITAVKSCGGVLKTPAASDKPTLYAIYEDFDGRKSETVIHGLRWDDELGLTICTNDMLDNYQYDNDYTFEYYFDFEGEDLEHLNKALEDAAYFVEFDRYDLQRVPTILSIINGIADYL